MPIQLAWLVLVFPALSLNYLGQGALVLARPEALENPFFLLVPDWALLPMVLLATAATVIASQAVITGAFSVTKWFIRQVRQLLGRGRCQVGGVPCGDAGDPRRRGAGGRSSRLSRAPRPERSPP